MRRFLHLPALILLLLTISFPQARGSSNTSPEDSLLFHKKIMEVWNLKYSAPDSAFLLATEAYAFAEHIQYEAGKGHALYYQGMIHYLQGDYPQSLVFADSALTIYLSLKLDYYIASIYNLQGLVNHDQGAYQDAIEAYLKSLRIGEKTGNLYGISNPLHNIGAAYVKLMDSERALDYLRRALAIRQEIDDTLMIAQSMLGIGEAHYQAKRPDSAKPYLETAILLTEKVNDRYGYARAKVIQGLILADRKQWPRAIAIFKESLAIQQELEDQDGQLTSMINLGEALINIRNPEEALKYLVPAWQLSKTQKARTRSMEVATALSRAYALTGQAELALAFQDSMLDIRDSIYDEKRNKQITELELQYETEKKDQQLLIQGLEIEKKNRQNDALRTRNLFSVALAILIIIIVIIVFLFRNRIRENKLRQTAQREQFQASFEAEEQERTRIARELHDGLGQVLATANLHLSGLEEETSSTSLHQSQELLGQAMTEVRQISHNLMPAALMRSGLIPALREMVRRINASGKIPIHLQLPEQNFRLKTAQEIHLYRIAQELLNNGMKHAGAKRIELQLSHDPAARMLSLQYHDNGAGFNPETIAESSGIGWRNLFSRVDMLQGELSIESQSGQGTQILIQAPVSDVREKPEKTM